MQAIHISHTTYEMNERRVKGSDWVRVMCAGQKGSKVELKNKENLFIRPGGCTKSLK